MAMMNYDAEINRTIRVRNTIRWEDLTGIYALNLEVPGVTLATVHMVEDRARVWAMCLEEVYNNEGRHE